MLNSTTRLCYNKIRSVFGLWNWWCSGESTGNYVKMDQGVKLAGFELAFPIWAPQLTPLLCLMIWFFPLLLENSTMFLDILLWKHKNWVIKFNSAHPIFQQPWFQKYFFHSFFPYYKSWTTPTSYKVSQHCKLWFLKITLKWKPLYLTASVTERTTIPRSPVNDTQKQWINVLKIIKNNTF